MNVEIGAEAPQFPEKEYINGISRCSAASVLAIYGLIIYTAPYIMLLKWATSITRATGGGVGPWKSRLF
jgi:hypothetical protein